MNTIIIHHPLVRADHPVLEAVVSVLGPSRFESMAGETSLKDAGRIIICAPAAQDAEDTIKWVSNHVDELCACPSVSLIEFGGMEEADSWAMDAQMQMGHPTSPGLAARLKDDDLDAAVDFALAIKTNEEHTDRKVPEAQLKADIEGFLSAHDVCTLTINVPGLPQGTILRYRYRNGHLVIASDQEALCSGLSSGQYVSVAVGDPQCGFAGLSGVQANGSCRIVHSQDADFAAIMNGLKIDQDSQWQGKKPICLVDVALKKAIFLCGNYADSGFDTRQVFIYQ